MNTFPDRLLEQKHSFLSVNVFKPWCRHSTYVPEQNENIHVEGRIRGIISLKKEDEDLTDTFG